MRSNIALLSFNRGLISPLGLARVDLDRLQLSAETQTNWIPRVLGSMMVRPGLEYLYTHPGKSLHIPFIAAVDDTAILELSNAYIRFSVNEDLIARPAVTAAITNGAFNANLGSWTDTDEAGAASAWATGGYMALLGTGTNFAKRNQLITVNQPNVLHSLIVDIARGPVVIKVGVTAGAYTYFSATLKTGRHSLAFTPTGNFYIEFSSELSYTVLVDAVAIGGSSFLGYIAPWLEADLPFVRKAQSADVVYITCKGYQPRRIERRDDNSWSICLEEPLDGPFSAINATPITIASSALSGDVTLTASRDLFTGLTTEHSGTLFKLTSEGQLVQASLTAENTFTASTFIVSGVGVGRDFTYSITGTWVATITLQRSTDAASWVDVRSFTANETTTFSDGLDNVEYYYRIGVKTGAYTSGTVVLALSFSGGSLTGIVKIRTVASPTSATATVISTLGGTAATANWYMGEWDVAQGFPSVVSLYEGRMWYAGNGKIWGSVSDEYSSFDDEVIGDSRSINRNIGEGAVNSIHWIAPLSTMVVGTSGSEIAVRSTSFEEPLTYVNFNSKNTSTKGSSNIDISTDDTRAIFVHRSGAAIYQLQYAIENNGYSAQNLSTLCPEVTEPSIVRIAIQQEPDTRIHCVRSDGKVAILIKDAAENTLAWVLFETDGLVQDAFVLPGALEDKVYYSVKRTINGSTSYYLERWALESEGRGGTTNKIADSYIYETGVSKATIDVAHLEGETVVLWGNGKNLGTYTVTAGIITPSETVTSYCVGLGYDATFKSAKLAYAAGMGTALNQVKKITQVGIIARDLHMDGITYGPSTTEQWDLPRTKDFQDIAADTVHAEFDEETFPFGGHWDADSRIVIKGAAPNPATLLAAIIGIQTNDKS